MIQKLRILPASVGLTLILGCGSPTAPELPAPEPDDPDDPKTDMIGFHLTDLSGMVVLA